MTPTKRTGTNPVALDHLPAHDLLRYQRMGRETRLTDQMLTPDIDTVSVVETGPAPAWTALSGDTVTFAADKMPTLYSRNGIAVWLGTNAHEVFHSLYTPRANTQLVLRVKAATQSTAPSMWRSFNVLEDQRIERLGLARYGKWRGYLIAALRHHIDAGDRMAWLLLAGRTWLPTDARAIARATFVGAFDEGTAKLAEYLIGSYQRLTDPADEDAAEAYRIIVEFDEAFGQVVPKGTCGGRRAVSGTADDTEVGATHCPHPPADEPEPEDEDELEPDDDEDDDEDDEPDDDEPDDGDADGDDEGDGDADGDDEGDEPGDDEGDEPGDDDDGDGDEGDDGDDGDGTSAPGKDKTLREALKDATADALSDDDTATDLDRVLDQVQNGTPGRAVDCRRTTGTYNDLTGEARLLARDVTSVLTEIKDDCEAAWTRRTDSGRFSVQRWATDPHWDHDEAFDLFDPGAMDASSLDCTLVLDISASMSAQIPELAAATWAIRSAIDRIEGTCTVLGFGDDVSLMFPVGSRPDGRLFFPHLEGSTNPTSACRVAHQMVAASDAANRIVIVMTDGQWWDGAPAEQAMQACRDAGAIVAVVGLGREAARHVPKLKGTDVAVAITSAVDLVPVFKDLAERSMKAAAARFGR